MKAKRKPAPQPVRKKRGKRLLLQREREAAPVPKLIHPSRRHHKRPRPDRYEEQLTEAELAQLRTDLLGSKKSLRQIIASAPRWRTGPMKGERISQSTLGNIRNRLMAEEDFKAAEAMTERILGEMAEKNPEMGAEQLEEFGLQLFTKLSIQNREVDDFVKLVRARKESEAVKLDAKRFQRETCELFLKWNASAEAKKIAGGGASNTEKIELLGKLMFGEDWNQ